VEITLPGAPALVDEALAQLRDHGAEAARGGDFARQALASGRLDARGAEALIALLEAGDAAAAARALAALRGRLAAVVTDTWQRLVALRAQVEAGLDFLDEPDVRSYEPEALRQELLALAARLHAWLPSGQSSETLPTVVLAGPANAGKSALFARLTGSPALVSPVAGTTRDWLDSPWAIDHRRVRLLDTAGWFAAAGAVDRAAVTQGQQQLPGAALVLLLSAPDAPLPPREQWPEGCAEALIVATKADGPEAPDPRAALAVSARSGLGLEDLAARVAARVGPGGSGMEARQSQALAAAATRLSQAAAVPALHDEILADDLRHAAELLAELLGPADPDAVLAVIFGRFCIGK
jgi:tRNA modification GTPase